MPRTIFIGDVHGCIRELSSLLDTLGPGTDDRVVFVGDLVARGPDTMGVLKLVYELGGKCVRGNHEQRLIHAHLERSQGLVGPRLSSSHEAVYHQLGEQDWDFLHRLPLSLEFPDHGVRVVHAGVVPTIPFQEQQAWTLMHIRSLTKLGAASDRYSERSWAADYETAPHVIFGHNARAGLQIHPYATGLDTACVYGEQLSALVLAKDQVPPPPDVRADLIVSVDAKTSYFI